jgi:hypothetical protein
MDLDTDSNYLNGGYCVPGLGSMHRYPDTDSPPTDTPTPITITHELEIILDPVDAAIVLLNPKPIEGGRYFIAVPTPLKSYPTKDEKLSNGPEFPPR